MKRYQPLQEKEVGKVRIDGYNITVYKNPQTLKNFQKGVRGGYNSYW